MATVDIDGIGKLYGETRAMRDVTISIGDGEFLVLVGPSGCGKSTLLRMIAGLEEISEGELRIDGKRMNEVAPRDRDIAMVFQSYALYPHMTVRQNLGFALKVRKVGRDEIADRVEEVAEMLGLTDLLGRLPKAMSGGQRQRVAMGRAIVRSPKVFLFDEPLSNLDASLRSQMRGELKALHRRLKSTMVYVTHDQVEAMTLADRIAVLRNGELMQLGTPEELYERPVNRFVAGFIGAPSMNFLGGRIEDDSLCGPSWRLPLGEDLRPESKIEDLVLGCRPHQLQLVGDGEGGLPGRVVLVEPTGWEAHIHVEIAGGVRVLARVETAALRGLGPGDAVRVRPRPGGVHWFEWGETGAAVG
jgi:multiple sugar transport system ATP-binding protein